MAFQPMPVVPQAGLAEWEFSFFNAAKQNIEELTGQRGNTGYKSVLQGNVGTNAANDLQMRQVTAKGAGFTISSQNVAGLDDYVKLITDVQTLANDVAYLRLVLNSLIADLKR